MSNPSINKTDFEDFARYLSSEMNADERQKFREKLSQQKEMKAELDSLENFWQRMENINPPDSNPKATFDTDTAWNRLNERIGGEELPVKEVHTRRSLPVWLKVAASVLIIVTLGITIWFISGKTEEAQLLSLTTEDEEITLVQKLMDGSVVYMAGNTRFRFPAQFDDQIRKVELTGEAFFDVSHLPDKPFFVETSMAQIEVLGTSFNVKTKQNNILEVFVETGSVRVQLRERPGEKFQLSQGELLTVQDDFIEKSYVAGLYNTAWRKNHMQFKDEKLENILAVLNQNFQINMRVEDPELNHRRLSVTFYNTSPEILGELIAVSLNIQFEISGQNEILFRK